jgi:hypothetical protein
MPIISLIICVHGDRVPLSRLLEHSVDCYDELLVIHDGPDFEDVRSLVEQYGGRFIERPRTFSQEPHFPFIFEQASHDWMLRLDSDEFPSRDLRTWLMNFRKGIEPPPDISGYECIWPAWNGYKSTTRGWPNKHLFLFHRHRVRCIGVYEHGVIVDAKVIRIPLILWHQPKGRSHGLRNIFGKGRTVQGRENTTRALLGSPLDHPRWRYEDDGWPANWQQIKDHPLLTALWRLLVWPPRQALAMLLAGDLPRPSVFAHSGISHAAFCIEFWRIRRRLGEPESPGSMCSK